MFNKYDAMIIFESSMSEENILKAMGRVKDEIGKLGGKCDDGRVVGKHSFARPMDKKKDGVYAKLGFELDAAQMGALNARFGLNDEVFRVQMTRAIEKKAQDAPEEAPQEKEEKSDG